MQGHLLSGSLSGMGLKASRAMSNPHSLLGATLPRATPQAGLNPWVQGKWKWLWRMVRETGLGRTHCQGRETGAEQSVPYQGLFQLEGT